MNNDNPYTDKNQNRPPEAENGSPHRAVQSGLISLDPETALEDYLTDKTAGYARKTVQAHRSRLEPFIWWCIEEAAIEDLSELTRRDLQTFRRWRRDQGDLKPISVKSIMNTLRVFIKWCEREGAVPTGLHENVYVPPVADDSRDTVIPSELVSEVLEWLRKYRYASIQHCVWELLADTGMRMGALRALDVEDYRADDYPYVEFAHRDKTDTPLKNGPEGERFVHLSKSAGDALEDYLQQIRPDVTDDCGRAPLLATKHGRIAPSTIRNYVYMLTCPCAIGDECPHDESPNDCVAAQSNNQSSKCPSSKSPHAIRRGVISHELRAGVPVATICQRCNVTEPVLRKHYDQLEEDERMAVRKEQMDSVHQEGGRYGG